MKNYLIIIILTISSILVSCSGNDGKSDAYGNFEAVETIISAEASGELLKFNIEEGMNLDSGAYIGYIDTLQLYLKLKQAESQKAAINSQSGTILTQVKVLEEQKAVAEKDKERIEKMFAQKAATQKQVDDIHGSIDVINRQILQIESQNPNVFNQSKSFDAQIAQVRDLIHKSIIINPMKGTVLNKYAEEYEDVMPGKALYKIANMDSIILRVYLTGSQLPAIKIGQKVKVFADKNSKDNKEYEGIITWVSEKAEFTPKIIQTKEERVNMVYAVKVMVKNDGTLKIGMPGEIKL